MVERKYNTRTFSKTKVSLSDDRGLKSRVKMPEITREAQCISCSFWRKLGAVAESAAELTLVGGAVWESASEGELSLAAAAGRGERWACNSASPPATAPPHPPLQGASVLPAPWPREHLLPTTCTTSAIASHHVGPSSKRSRALLGLSASTCDLAWALETTLLHWEETHLTYFGSDTLLSLFGGKKTVIIFH